MGAISAKQQTATTSWARMVRADDIDVVRANQQLKRSISDGATGVSMVFEGAHNAFGYGLPARPDTIKRLFENIELQGLHLRLDNHPHGAILSNQFVEFLQQNYTHLRQTKITFGIDPTASLASCGKLKMSIAALKASQPQSMSAFFASGLPGIILEADGRPYHNAGASRVQELGAMLCVADEHLSMVEAGRHPIVYALPHIGFATALTSNFCANLVKLHVLRQMWLRLQQNRGIKQPLHAHIHVETSRRMLSRYNSALNNARNHCAALAAVAGGAVSLSVLPTCTPLGLPAPQARQDALVGQLVLARENPELSQYSPALGDEVDNLSQQVWSQYQSFKKAGGVMAGLIDGSLNRLLTETYERSLPHDHKRVNPFPQDLEQTTSNIYGDAPISTMIEGISHCQPLTPVYADD